MKNSYRPGPYALFLLVIFIWPATVMIEWVLGEQRFEIHYVERDDIETVLTISCLEYSQGVEKERALQQDKQTVVMDRASMSPLGKWLDCGVL